MHKVFISYHHKNDQYYKEELLRINNDSIFIDGSVDTGDIDEDLPDERIRTIIRDDYLRDTTVTIVLAGAETARRKHIDWEIYSSMFDGPVNKKSGVLVVTLPGTNRGNYYTVAHGDAEKKMVYPDHSSGWMSIDTKAEYLRRYPELPDRVIDNLLTHTAKISVVPWERFVHSTERIEFLVEATFQDRTKATYDLSQPMRRTNS